MHGIIALQLDGGKNCSSLEEGKGTSCAGLEKKGKPRKLYQHYKRLSMNCMALVEKRKKS